MRTRKAILADIRALKAEMKARSIQVKSVFNGGLTADEYRYNNQLFALKTELYKLDPHPL